MVYIYIYVCTVCVTDVEIQCLVAFILLRWPRTGMDIQWLTRLPRPLLLGFLHFSVGLDTISSL